MKVKKFIPYLLPLALTVSLSAQAATDYIDTFQLNAVDSGSISPSFIEGLTGHITYDINTSVMSNATFTQIDNSTNPVGTYTFDLSNGNASYVSFSASANGFAVYANFDTAGDENPGFGALTIAVNAPNGPLTVGTSYALQSGSIYDFGGNTYALTGSLTLTAQQVIDAPTTPVVTVPEPEEWAMLLLGLPLIGWVVRRKQAAAAGMAPIAA